MAAIRSDAAFGATLAEYPTRKRMTTHDHHDAHGRPAPRWACRIVLLCSIIIKNSILMVDFIQERRRAGQDAFAAALGAVQLRYRPILMTAFGTIAGMIPIAMQQKTGRARFSALAIDLAAIFAF